MYSKYFSKMLITIKWSSTAVDRRLYQQFGTIHSDEKKNVILKIHFLNKHIVSNTANTDIINIHNTFEMMPITARFQKK